MQKLVGTPPEWHLDFNNRNAKLFLEQRSQLAHTFTVASKAKPDGDSAAVQPEDVTSFESSSSLRNLSKNRHAQRPEKRAQCSRLASALGLSHVCEEHSSSVGHEQRVVSVERIEGDACCCICGRLQDLFDAAKLAEQPQELALLACSRIDARPCREAKIGPLGVDLCVVHKRSLDALHKRPAQRRHRALPAKRRQRTQRRQVKVSERVEHKNVVRHGRARVAEVRVGDRNDERSARRDARSDAVDSILKDDAVAHIDADLSRRRNENVRRGLSAAGNARVVACDGVDALQPRVRFGLLLKHRPPRRRRQRNSDAAVFAQRPQQRFRAGQRFARAKGLPQMPVALCNVRLCAQTDAVRGADQSGAGQFGRTHHFGAQLPVVGLPVSVRIDHRLRRSSVDRLCVDQRPVQVEERPFHRPLCVLHLILISDKAALSKVATATPNKIMMVELTFGTAERRPLTIKVPMDATQLNLRERNITEIPPEIGNLVNLTGLFLHHNKLTTIPPEIGNLVNLTELDLQFNELTAFPHEIGNLVRLTKLWVNGNPFTSDARLKALADRSTNVAKEVLVLFRIFCCDHTFEIGSVHGKQCEVCGEKFRGLFKKGMICRRCGGEVHEGCAEGAATLRLKTVSEGEVRRKATTEDARRKEAAEEVRRKEAAEEVRHKEAAEEARRKRAAKGEAQFKGAAEKARQKAEQLQAPAYPQTRQSSVADVRRWLVSIDLGEITGIFERNRIDGSVLFDLSETDLEKIGVAAFGHRKKLLSALRDLQTPPSAPVTAPSVVVTTSSIPDSRAAAATATGGSALPQQRRAKFVAPESESVTYKGLLELPDSYMPQGTCAQELLAARAVLGSKVPQLELIVKEVGSVSWSILAGQTAQELVKTHGLTEQEVFAIVAYTYDLGLSGVQSENLYFQLNELLRRRVQHEMRAVMGYLYFILGAMRKLPAFEGTVFRGNNSPGMVAREYTTGREIFWSGFTSTTTDLAAALDFAGRDGVVFRIKINSGRSIALLSVMQRENEVLLPPNACLMVFSEMHREADGVQYVDLVEKKDSFRW